MSADRALRLVTIAAILGLGALGLLRAESILSGGVAWLVFLFFALSGAGWLVTRVARVADPDFGLRAAWGMAGLIAIAGPLVMLGVCSRPVVLVLIAASASGFLWRELVTSAPLWRIARDGSRLLRARPLVGYLAIALGLAAIVHLLGAVVELERNPWDDDVAYMPLVKRLLDAGDQIEPFSFRRLGAYGGQIVLQALGGARGSLANPHLIDQGLCFGVSLLLLLGYVREVGKVGAVWLALLVTAVLVLPDISINTASYWSGVVFFFALYRTIARDDGTRRFAIAAVIAAATCTLRQSYLPVVALFLIGALMSRMQIAASTSTWREAWRDESRRVGLTIALVATVLLPWCIAAFLSNRTFLFPFMQGTWNHGLSLSPPGWSWVDKLSFFINIVVDAQPFVVLPVVFPLFLLSRDERPARPLTALLVSSMVGFVVLVASFMGSDANSLSRYAFGYLVPLLFAFVVEIGREEAGASVTLAPLGRWVLLAALIIQVAFPRAGVAKRYRTTFVEIAEASRLEGHGEPTAREEAARYAAMQRAVPAGEKIAVLLDDPAYLDFARNRIFNLDTPGYASPAPQLPMFTTPADMQAYFIGQGIHYLAFVRSDRSRYMFRRGFWLWRVFHDTALFQAMSAYTIYALDTFESLARTATVVHDEAGLVVLHFDGAVGPAPHLDPREEDARRDGYLADLAEREGLSREWALTSRNDLIFSDGMSDLTFDELDADPRWFDVFARTAEPHRGTPVRWLHRRAHLRVKGRSDMHLVIRGRVNLASIYTRPRLDVALDGELLGSQIVGANGAFTIDLVVPASHFDGWADLYLVFNTIGTPERDVKDLRVARLDEVRWEPR